MVLAMVSPRDHVLSGGDGASLARLGIDMVVVPAENTAACIGGGVVRLHATRAALAV